MNSKNDFHLKGYTLPLSPKGRSSLMDAPPWYYGGDVLHLAFYADPEKVKALIPPPLEIGPNPGEGAVWFVEWVSVSEANPDLAFVNPERAIYRECIVMVGCQYQGKAGYFVPYIWVDNDFTLMRGFIQGFPKKLGRIYITKLHDLNPKVGGKRVGARVKGICEVHGERIVEGSMVFTHPAGPGDLPQIKFYLMRHFPDIEDPTKPAVHEITAGKVSDVKIGDVWRGEVDIRFMESAFEEVADLAPIRMVGGFYFSMGMTIMGGEVLYRYT